MQFLNSALKVVSFTYSVTKDGGGIGTYDTGISIPKGACIVNTQSVIIVPVLGAAGNINLFMSSLSSPSLLGQLPTPATFTDSIQGQPIGAGFISDGINMTVQVTGIITAGIVKFTVMYIEGKITL